jgi:hypothetical protein
MSRFTAKLLRISVFLLLCLGGATRAWALNTSSVFSPDVKDGTKAVEYRLSTLPEESPTEWAQRLHYQQAIDDTWRWRIIGLFFDPGRGGGEFRYARFELMQQFVESEKAGWDSALRYELQIADSDNQPSRGRVAWSGKWNWGEGWEFRANVLVGLQFGERSHDGILVEHRTQFTGALNEKWRLGLESFHDFNDTRAFGGFDDQEHQLGPILKGKFGDGWSVALSWLFGVSDSADDNDLRIHLIRGF